MRASIKLMLQVSKSVVRETIFDDGTEGANRPGEDSR